MTHIVDNMDIEGRLRAQRVVQDFRSQATAGSTLSLVAADATLQVFTGTTTGQIVQLPDATTLTNGHRYEVLNLSTRAVWIQDGAVSPTVLAHVSQSRRCVVVLQSNSTQAGSWAALNDVCGANWQSAENTVLATNTSQTTYNAHTTLTPTNELPAGTYEIYADFRLSTSGANRIFQGRVTQDGADIGNFEEFITDVDQRIFQSVVRPVVLAATSTPVFVADFRVSPGAGTTTANLYSSSLILKRVK